MRNRKVHQREGDRLSERLSRVVPRGAIVLVFLAVSFIIAYELLPILKLIAMAMLLALVLRTAVHGLNKLGSPPWLSVIILVLGMAAVGVFGWLVLVPRIVREIQRLISGGPGSLEALAKLLQDVPFIPDPSQLVQQLEDYLSQTLGSLPTLVVETATVLAAILAVIFLAIYMAVSPDSLVTGALRFVPREHRSEARQLIDRTGSRLRGWIIGTVLVSIFVGVGAGIGLWVLGVPLPITFGIIAGVLNVIPYLGAIVGGLLPALVALTISPIKALLVLVLFLVLNQTDGNVLKPLIMGHQVHAHPAMVLIFILAFAKLLGVVIGTILAVPAVVLAGVLMEELTDKEPSALEEEEGEAQGE